MKFKKGHTPWNKGKKGVQMHSEITKEKMKKSHIGLLVKEKSNFWNGGVCGDLKNDRKNGINRRRRELRHLKDISKKYSFKYGGPKPFTKREQHLLRKYNMKKAGKLTIQTIQRVYEDNIKKYGTLTCYLCLKPINFRQDSLEHKMPISRGGTNLYENLAIAHRKCNSKKHTKTEEEYREGILNNGL